MKGLFARLWVGAAGLGVLSWGVLSYGPRVDSKPKSSPIAILSDQTSGCSP